MTNNLLDFVLKYEEDKENTDFIFKHIENETYI